VTQTAPKQMFSCLIQGTVIGRTEQGHTASGGGRAYVKFRIIHRTGFRRGDSWISTSPMEFEVTCWDEQQMLLARSLKPGTDVLVTVKKFFPYISQSDEPIMSITPADIVPLPPTSAGASTERRQRSGDLVVTPHGEKIAADAWPDVVVDPELVHHG
jgi:hypothetical protein